GRGAAPPDGRRSRRRRARGAGLDRRRAPRVGRIGWSRGAGWGGGCRDAGGGDRAAGPGTAAECRDDPAGHEDGRHRARGDRSSAQGDARQSAARRRTARHWRADAVPKDQGISDARDGIRRRVARLAGVAAAVMLGDADRDDAVSGANTPNRLMFVRPSDSPDLFFREDDYNIARTYLSADAGRDARRGASTSRRIIQLTVGARVAALSYHVVAVRRFVA